MMNNGILAINKPSGWTSFDVVNKVKHLLHCPRVGHLGTLDPIATGVLLVTIGKATKIFDLAQSKQKTYIAKFKFGYSTDSLDATGKIENTTTLLPTFDQLESVRASFIGEIAQIPPKFSAKSINGVRAYDLARQNKQFEIPAKNVKIYSIDYISYIDSVLTLKIVCGSGTYIRSLCRDIALKVNSLATMVELTRTKVGKIDIGNCVDISALSEQNIASFVLPLSKFLDYSQIELPVSEQHNLLCGQTLNLAKPDGLYLLMDNTNVLAIVKIANNLAKMSIFLG